MTRQLLTFARGGNPIREITSLAELITKSVGFAVHGSNVLPKIEIAGDLWPADIDGGQINQVLSNLIINADQAMPEGGILTVTAKNIELTGQENLPLPIGKYIKITVRDEGVGIPENDLSKIFDPYFTTKPMGNGLGLATAYSIIQNHEGYIEVASEFGRGTSFSVYLPASSTEIQMLPEVESLSPVTGAGRILVMDDEEIVREFLEMVLGRLGYSASFTKDGEEAITLYQQAQENGRPFQAVIMDLTIPGGMGGKVAIQKLLEIDPQVKAIVSSGYSNDPVMANYKLFGFKGVVVKPYQVQELSECLHTVLKG